MAIEISRLKAIVEADLRNYEVGLHKAEADAQRTARKIKSEFDGIKLPNVFSSSQQSVNGLRNFRTEVEKTRHSVRGIGNDIGELLEDPVEGLFQLGANFGKVGIAVAAATLAVGAAVYGFIKLTQHVITQARELDNLSRITGVTAENLQVLQLAAAESGVDLKGVADAISDLQSKAIDASSGNEKLRETFRRLGIDAKQAIDQPEQAFNALAKRIAEIPQATERAAAAQAIYGEAGRQLLPVFDKLAQDQGQFQRLLQESGAAMDKNLIAQAKAASREFEELKVRGQGALNDIARESLPAVTSLLREVNDLIKELRPSFKVAGEAASDFTNGLKNEMEDVLRLMAIISDGNEGLQRANRAIAKSRAAQANSIEEARYLLKEGTGGALVGGAFSAKEIEELLAFGPSHKFVPGNARTGGGFRPPPDIKSGANQELRAQLDLDRARAEARAEALRDAKQRELKILELGLADELRAYGRNYDDSITALNDYYARRISLQRDAINAEINLQKELLASLQKGEEEAKTKAEKTRIQAQQVRAKSRINILTSSLGDVDLTENAARNNAARGIRSDRDALAKDLASEIKKLQSELVNLTGTPLDRFNQDLDALTGRLQYLAIVLGNKNALQALKEFRQAATQNFNDSRLPIQYDTAVETLNTGRDRIQNLADRGIITEGSARRQILELEAKMRDTLRENLNLQIQIAKARGDELTAARLTRELDQVEQLGDFGREGQDRVKAFKENVAQMFDSSIEALVTGQAKFGDVWRSFVSNVVNDMFNKMQETLIKKLTGGQYSSIGAILGDFLGNLVGGLLGGPKVSGARAEGGSIFAGNTYLVGEKGPELVRFNNSGHVYSNADSKQMLSHRGMVIHINVPISAPSGAVPQATQRQIATAVAAEISNMMRRNG
ncbi:MAG TPA: hypothetical protein VEF04_12225 [Blastocatellia bacterium]|nr:hypothetical protein [Blastocatellia bacterium]